uniref:Uncharacterized protein n=1 Tax=Rhizophora mucronata TaxID=61149 RepID=A0A2P2QPS1_RHIMU
MQHFLLDSSEKMNLDKFISFNIRQSDTWLCQSPRDSTQELPSCLRGLAM